MICVKCVLLKVQYGYCESFYCGIDLEKCHFSCVFFIEDLIDVSDDLCKEKTLEAVKTNYRNKEKFILEL